MVENRVNNRLVCFLILMLPFSWVSTSLGSFYRICIIVAVAIWVINSDMKLRFSYKSRSIFKVWTLYTLYSSLSCIWASDRGESISNSFGMVLLYMMSLIFITATCDKRMIDQMDICWLIDTVLLLVMFLFGGTQQVGWGERQTLVILGSPTDANEFASFFIIGTYIALKLFFNKNNKIIKTITIVIVVLNMYVVLMTASRGALLSMVVVVTFVLAKNMSLKKAAMIVLLAVLVFFVSVLFIFPNIPSSSLERITFEALLDDGGSGRTDIWSSGIKNFFDCGLARIFFGHGYGRFGIYTSSGYTELMMHNQFIQQLISYGIVGLIIYLVLIIYAEKILRNERNDYWGCFWGMIFMSLTLTMGPSYKFLWIILFMSMMSHNTRDNNAT